MLTSLARENRAESRAPVVVFGVGRFLGAPLNQSPGLASLPQIPFAQTGVFYRIHPRVLVQQEAARICS